MLIELCGALDLRCAHNNAAAPFVGALTDAAAICAAPPSAGAPPGVGANGARVGVAVDARALAAALDAARNRCDAPAAAAVLHAARALGAACSAPELGALRSAERAERRHRSGGGDVGGLAALSLARWAALDAGIEGEA